MAITYVNDLRLSEMDTGDNSGTWGTVTNTNLELIGEALGYGTEAITTNADTHSSEIADGSTDPVRAMYVKYTGTLDSACTITIGPNTVNKFYYIENATSGSQNIIIKQGSDDAADKVTIPAGDVKAVYLDGAGSGAVVRDAFASLSVVDLKVQDDLTVTDDLIVGGDIDLEGSIDVNGTANLDIVDIDGAVQIDNTVSVGVDDTGYDVKFFGDTASAYMLWDASADDLILGGAAGLSVNSAALVTGVLTTTAATVFNGGFAANAACTITTADNLSGLIIKTTDTDANVGPTIQLKRDVGRTALADGDLLGNLIFVGNNDADPTEATVYANMGAVLNDFTNGTEDGTFYINRIIAGIERSGMIMQSGTNGADPETVFNEDAQNINFRVESNGDANMLFLDGGENRIGIGTASPLEILSIEDSGNTPTVYVDGNPSPTKWIGRANRTGAGQHITEFVGKWNDDLVARIVIAAGDDTTNKDDGRILLYTAPSGTMVERQRIEPNGEVIFNDTGIDADFRVESTGNANMFLVDASTNRVGINTSAPEAVLHAQESGAASKKGLQVSNYDATAGTAQAINVDFGLARNSGSTKAEAGRIKVGRADDWTSDDSKVDSYMSFSHYKNNTLTEAMRINGSSDILFNESDASSITNGTGAYVASNGQFYASTSSSSGHFFNVQSDNQTVLVFRHAGVSEGNVHINGSTVTYNGFSGTHESSGIASDTAIGTVCSTIDELDTYASTQIGPDGTEDNPRSGQTRADHAKIKVSDQEGDTRVYGVLQGFDPNGKATVASVGIGSVRVTGACSGGDLLESNGDGTAKVQSDDIVRSKTLGKVTIGNSNTGVKLVSCVLYCG
jgi:hypothetical protein